MQRILWSILISSSSVSCAVEPVDKNAAPLRTDEEAQSGVLAGDPDVVVLADGLNGPR